ncbi:MAG: divergent polysaccharide deacetylase family protein [Spirochaetota bacterium]|nr:MAG: divergent polysaccharide deacetylase family protein [Spirochaetota bacterium]
MIKTKGKKNKHYWIITFIVLALAIILLLLRPIAKKVVPPPTVPPVTEKEKEKLPEKEYRIAIIIDDVGYASENLDEWLSFNGKLTFSVLPFLSESEYYSKLFQNHGFEIMLHVPMEPVSYPEDNPGPDALFTNTPKEAVIHKLEHMIAQNPYATGANNHMGSRATQDDELMRWTLEVLRKEKFFFIDSVTTPASHAYTLAREIGVPAAKRDIFLDNEHSFDYINKQFENLKVIAKQNGTAIGIGHFTNENTLKVLNHQLSKLGEQNFKLIYASEAVQN